MIQGLRLKIQVKERNQNELCLKMLYSVMQMQWRLMTIIFMYADGTGFQNTQQVNQASQIF